MAAVIWTERALRSLNAIRDYIARDNPHAAEKLADRVLDRAESLANHPRIGSLVAEDQAGIYRELFEGNYRIIYRVDGDRVYIATIFHAARLFDPSHLT